MGLNSLTESRNIDLLLSSTFDTYRRSFADGVSTNIPYLFFLIDRGMKVSQAGGVKIRLPIHGANNDTFESYAPYGTLNTSAQDNQVMSTWDWKNLSVSITIDGPTLRKNSGSDVEIINILRTKIEGAEIAMREGISDQLFGTGDDASLDLNGLQNILSTSTTTGTTGALQRSINTFWQHKSRNVSSAFATNGVNRMRSLYNDCLTGTQKITLIVATQSVMENYELGMTSTAGQSERFVVSSPFNSIKGDQGLHIMRYKGAMMFFDDNVVANSTYFINTDTVMWYVHPDADFVTRPFLSVPQQDVKLSQILVQANQVCSNLQRNGVLLNGDTI